MHYLQQNIDITNLSNFKTKATTKYYFEINSINDVLKINEIKNFANTNNLKLLFIWWGTNTLFAFSKFNWIVIKNNLRWYNYDLNTKILEVSTQENIRDIALILKEKYKNDLWYRFIWLPGSIWGAIYWNAWCFWLETENNFLSVEAYNFSTWRIENISRANAKFSYRNSIFKETNNYFLLKAFFDLSKMEEKYSNDKDIIQFREEIQPNWNSCGSFFKNPNKEFSAGKLIEEVWLKWFSVWNAYFSEKHANFLMMKWDNWDYKELFELIKLAQNKVKEAFKIELIPEVNIIES